MIDILEMKQKIRDLIITDGSIATTDIAWENLEFDPTGKTIWYKEKWFPITDEANTPVQDLSVSLLRFDINVKKDQSIETIDAAIKTISNLFSWGTIITTGTMKIVVDENKRGNATADDVWYTQPLLMTIRAIDNI